MPTMKTLWDKALRGKTVEAGLNLLDAAIGLGLVSGAAVAATIGNLMLCAILAAFAFGVLARLTRRKSKKSIHPNNRPSGKAK